MRGILNRIFNFSRTKQTNKDTLRDDAGCRQFNDDLDTDTIVPCITVGYAQSIGRQREHNEDSIFVLNTTIISNNDVLPFGLFIVADGMGGHQYGEIASNVAVRSFANHLIETVYQPVLTTFSQPDEKEVENHILDAVSEANRKIIQSAPGGGTTLTALIIYGTCMTIAHVGDSRIYLLDEQENTKLLTRDHSLVNRLVELGQISNNEAAAHPQRNVLYRAMGQGEPFNPDISSTILPDSGFLLLCSDGLWGVVDDAEMVKTTLASEDPQTTCDILIDAANNAGGADNISIILIRLTSK